MTAAPTTAPDAGPDEAPAGRAVTKRILPSP